MHNPGAETFRCWWWTRPSGGGSGIPCDKLDPASETYTGAFRQRGGRSKRRRRPPRISAGDWL